MRAPRFWNTRVALATLLLPIAGLYQLGYALRCLFTTPTRLSVPVICVGNITMGGAGKTPTVIALAEYLQQAGHTPHIISRGYGGSIAHTTRVDSTDHNSAMVGDEPLLLSLHAPTWVGRNRVASANAAIAEGATHIIMDDGMQNPTLHKDATLCVIDGGYGLGNGLTFPSGPLREIAEKAFKRSTATLVIGAHKREETTEKGETIHILDCATGSLRFAEDAPCFTASVTPHIAGQPLDGTSVHAFAGIGRPEKFFDTVSLCGAHLTASHPFPDHHPYTDAEIEKLLAAAHADNARLVTTRKDYVRLPETYRSRVTVIDISLNIQELDFMATTLLEACNERTAEVK